MPMPFFCSLSSLKEKYELESRNLFISYRLFSSNHSYGRNALLKVREKLLQIYIIA